MRKSSHLMMGLIIAFALGFAGCGDGGNDAPPPFANVTGTWIGPYTSSNFGSQTATLNLVQTGAAITGTFSSSTGSLGNVVGPISGNTAFLTIIVTTPGCTGAFSGTGKVDGNTMFFSYNGAASINCGGAENGSGNLTKQ